MEHQTVLEELRKGAKIVSEHQNVRGAETVVIELTDGTRRTVPNVSSDTLQQYMETQEEGGKKRTQGASEHHSILEELRKGARIISEHTNVRGDETVVIELQNGTRRAIPNVRKETLQQYMEAQEEGGKARGQEEGGKGRGQGGSEFGVHSALEELRKGRARIVSEHTNARGDETVVVELPDGTRRAIPNVKKETLQQYMEAQEEGKKARTQGGSEFGIHSALDELRKGSATIVSEHTNVRGEETVVIEFSGGSRRSIPNVRKETLQQCMEAQEEGRRRRVSSE